MAPHFLVPLGRRSRVRRARDLLGAHSVKSVGDELRKYRQVWVGRSCRRGRDFCPQKGWETYRAHSFPISSCLLSREKLMAHVAHPSPTSPSSIGAFARVTGAALSRPGGPSIARVPRARLALFARVTALCALCRPLGPLTPRVRLRLPVCAGILLRTLQSTFSLAVLEPACTYIFCSNKLFLLQFI